jgi:hypothetical protein
MFYIQLKVRLSNILGDPKTSLEVLVFAAISLGLVFVGSCNEEIAQLIIFALMERSDAELGDALTRLLPVALGLLYLGKQVALDLFLHHFLFFIIVFLNIDLVIFIIMYQNSDNLIIWNWIHSSSHSYILWIRCKHFMFC